MAGTRSSGCNTASSSSPNTQSKSSPKTTGRKRKASPSASPRSKRGKKGESQKEQKTLEETMPDMTKQNDLNDTGMQEAADDVEYTNGNGTDTNTKTEHANGKFDNSNGTVEDKEEITINKAEYEALKAAQQTVEKFYTTVKTSDHPATKNVPAHGNADVSQQDTETHNSKDASNGEVPKQKPTTQPADEKPADHKIDEDGTSNMDFTGEVKQAEDENSNQNSKFEINGAVEESQERRDAMPANILEKGIIYFFVRARVSVDHPEGVQDIARSYVILRPLPNGAKLGEGALDDSNNNRLLALPKKVLPKSHRDTFLTFVERAGATIEELKEDFMKGSDYDTKTTGTRHSPAMTPVGEGIYAITTTGRETHLAYMLTIPSSIGEVQEEIGLMSQGSFALSVKNPMQPGPANANLPHGPEFPKEIIEEFRNLRWMPLQPKHLDYANTQFLLIGSGHGGFGHAVDASAKDEKNAQKITALEEMEKLEAEDEHRVEGLKGDDAVFADLGISHKEFPKLKTTW